MDPTPPQLLLSKILARNITNATDFDDTFKLMETWARPLWKGEPIEMDGSDRDLFKGILKNKNAGLPQFVKEAALKVIRETDNAAENAKANKVSQNGTASVTENMRTTTN